MKDSLSKSIINELDVLSWEHEQRLKAIERRNKLVKLENCNTYQSKTVKRNDCIVTYYIKNKK